MLCGIDHAPTHLAIRAERELQRMLAGDCALPVGVRTTISGVTIRMKAILFGPESEPPKLAEAEAETPEAVAESVFAALGR